MILAHATPSERDRYLSWLERLSDACKRGTRMREFVQACVRVIGSVEGGGFYD